MLVYPSLAVCFLVVASGSPNDDNNRPLIEKYPYVASIEYDNQFIGGGSIVSRYFVLTFAYTVWMDAVEYYVVNGGLLSVRVGSDFSKKDGSVHSVCNHKILWQNAELVALLQLDDPISFDRTHQPIRLFDTADKIEPGAKVTLSAWSNWRSASAASPPLQIFEGVLKADCPDPFTDRVFCIDTPEGMHGRMGLGHPVVINGTQAGVVAWTIRYVTYITDGRVTSNWIAETMKQLAKDNTCKGNAGIVNDDE